jgi:hypothetical protein
METDDQFETAKGDEAAAAEEMLSEQMVGAYN